MKRKDKDRKGNEKGMLRTGKGMTKDRKEIKKRHRKGNDKDSKEAEKAMKTE